MERVETGALMINDDWTGLFVRGDDTLSLEEVLEEVCRAHETGDLHLSPSASFLAEHLVEVIKDCVRHGGEMREVRMIKAEEA